MVFKRIHIDNYGCIGSFDYSFSTNDSGRPKPLVLIGKNGSGKTLVLANLIDALVETKRNIYPGGIAEVRSSNYYKVEKKTYIKSGQVDSFVQIDYTIGNQSFSYYDMTSFKPEESLKKEPFQEALKKVGQRPFSDTGYQKSVQGSVKASEYEKEVFVYFPVDRFSIPNWLNDQNYTKIEYDPERFVGQSNRHIIKMDVCGNIYDWVYKVYSFQRIRQWIDLSGGKHDELLLSPVQSALNQLLRAILGDRAEFMPASRKLNMVSIVCGETLIPDLRNLSSGELMAFSMFASLIKDYDENHDNVNLADIHGVCIIDEIDLNMHIDQQMNVLPKLIQLFPNVQFVVSTHSPFFVKGLYDALGGFVDLVEMPSGKPINHLADFSEIQETIRIFEDGQDLLLEIDELKNKLESLQNEAGKTLVLTEGITDSKYIKKAFIKLGVSMSDYQFTSMEENEIKRGGDDELCKTLDQLCRLGDKAPRIVAIFDSDNAKITDRFPPGKLTTLVSKRIYAFSIPIPPKRKGAERISIEHYFTDDELRTPDKNGRKLYQLDEFFPAGALLADKDKICPVVYKLKLQHPAHYVLSGSGDQKVTDLDGKINYSLSKNEFCKNVINDVPGFDSFSFEDFSLIIDLIEQAKKEIVGSGK